jgi:eukaryotic-like serine/threonine-protein kinase
MSEPQGPKSRPHEASTPITAVRRSEEAALEGLEVEDLVRALADAQRDRYRSQGMIAQGGMGTIEAAVDRTIDRRTVIKRLHEELERDAKQARMFVREAQVTGQLQHPGIVPVHELGVDAAGHIFYSMELVEGRTLEQWLAELPPGRLDRSALFDLLDVVVRVCDSLAYAHKSGVLHCDVKPPNIMVGEFGQVYLMDWGIARFAADEKNRDPKNSGAIVGTPTHMAPEQARGEPIDERADVFAVGGLLYQIVTRRMPFAGANTIHALVNAVTCNYTHPDQVPEASGTPAALTRIVLKAMAAKPADRFASILDLKDALVRFMRGVDPFPRICFDAGETIVREGEPGSDAYVIESGRCEVHRTIDGERRSIRVMGPGEVFGEMAVLAPGARTATVTALEPTALLRITAESLQAEVESMKPWMGALVRTLAERFRDRESGR